MFFWFSRFCRFEFDLLVLCGFLRIFLFFVLWFCFYVCLGYGVVFLFCHFAVRSLSVFLVLFWVRLCCKCCVYPAIRFLGMIVYCRLIVHWVRSSSGRFGPTTAGPPPAPPLS